MARVGLWRLNSQGAAAIQQKYRQGRWVNVAAFCNEVGIPRSTYYELIGRDTWFEQTTLYDKLSAIGIPTSERPELCECRNFEDEISPTAPGRLDNLPRPITSFIGRETEIVQIRELLNSAALLTLTGTGGSGKTRLALQVAGQLRENFPQGVWLVELGSVSEPDLVPEAVAAVFALREQRGTSLTQTLCTSLSAQRLLLILDNCEHLLASAAALVQALLRTCPNIRLIATSRQRLAIPGEQIYGVQSLALPNAKLKVTVETVENIESVQMFVERVRLYRPTFQLNSHNVHSVVSLCCRLDGIPLALEIAAAQVRVLSVADLLDRLEDQFEQLPGGHSSVETRHQTLRALTDWSYNMLPQSEQLLLQRLSVFSGGWTLAAAEELGAADPIAERDVLGLLASLVDRSLVLAEEQDGAVRYRMYDTIRHYAAEKLHLSGDRDSVLTRRCEWAIRLAREAGGNISRGEDHAKWVHRLETEHDNIRAALAMPAQGTAGAEGAMQLASSLWRFWMTTGHSKEGLEHLKRALQRPDAHVKNRIRAQALDAAGNLADNLGDHGAATALYLEGVLIQEALLEDSPSRSDRAQLADSYHSIAYVSRKNGDVSFSRQMFEKSQSLHLERLQMRREAGDRAQIALALTGPGHIAAELGDYTLARSLLEESLALYKELGDKNRIAMALIDLSFVPYKQGDFAEVLMLYEESVQLKREIGDLRGVALAYYEMGQAAWKQGNYDTGQRYFAAGMKAFVDLGDRQHVAMCMDGLGCVLYASAQPHMAILLWGAASALHDALGTPIALEIRIEYEQYVARALEAFGRANFDIAWLEGRAQSWEQIASNGLTS